MAPRTEATGVFLVRLRAVFRSGFRLDPDKFLAIREFHVVHGMCLLSNVPGLADQLVASQEDSARKRGNVGGKIPELSAKPYFVGLFSRAWPCTEASLGSQDMILANGGRRNVPYAKGFRSGQRSGQTLVKLGQPWSNLVEFGQSSPNSGKCIPEHVLRVSGQGGTLVGLETARSNLGQLWSNLVNSSQTWSTLVKLGQTLGNVSRTFFLGVFDAARLVRISLGDHPGLETETNRGRIGLGDHPGLETKFVIRVRIGLGDHPGLETETNRGRIGLGDHPGLETKFVIRVRIGLGDHPGLETETNRGRIGLGDHPGLETKFVIRVRIGLGDHPGLETEDRGRIGLGDHPGLETKFVIRVRIGLGDHPGLETKFVIRVRIGLGDHPGLETETNRGRIGLGDHPVVAEIVAGPHALDSCESPLLGFVADGGIPCGPFLRDFGSVCFRCHASFIEVVVALFVGSECTCIPYFRLSYLTVSTSMSAECVYDERFPSNFLEPLNTTHGLVEPRRKNCPSIKVETGAWPSFSYGQHSTKASVWDCVWAFSGQGMLFEGSLGEKVLNIFQGFLASGLTGGLEGEMNFIGCCNSAQILL
uniref:Uncharacterized protein n=1 Tax=Fagus sylvatica TaxID=28930 RepID=A0A2N9F2G4_FAGSY